MFYWVFQFCFGFRHFQSRLSLWIAPAISIAIVFFCCVLESLCFCVITLSLCSQGFSKFMNFSWVLGFQDWGQRFHHTLLWFISSVQQSLFISTHSIVCIANSQPSGFTFMYWWISFVSFPFLVYLYLISSWRVNYLYSLIGY